MSLSPETRGRRKPEYWHEPLRNAFTPGFIELARQESGVKTWLCNMDAHASGCRSSFFEGSMQNTEPRDRDDQQEAQDEKRKIRRLQIMMDMVMSVIAQDADLTVEEAAEMAANTKRAALAMFPDKELAYDLIYRPRLQRLIRERFRVQ
jgi:hypothetical protein